MTRIEIAAVALVASLCSTLPVPAAASEWGYTSRDGSIPPVDWGDVARICRTGRSQSPVAIGTSVARPGEGMAAPHISYGRSHLRVFNNGHTIEAEVEEGAGHLEIGGTRFDLLQFHVHWRSEHFIDGSSHAAELHLVHADADGKLAVLAVLLRGAATPNPRLNPFFEAAGRLPREGDETRIARFDLRRLLPVDATGYFHYVGSLTTPPCTEGVAWWLFDAPQTIGAAQRAMLRVGIPPSRNPEGNRRPVQSLNRRVIFHVED